MWPHLSPWILVFFFLLQGLFGIRSLIFNIETSALPPTMSSAWGYLPLLDPGPQGGDRQIQGQEQSAQPHEQVAGSGEVCGL